MQQLFQDRLREVRGDGLGTVKVWGAGIADVVVHASAEWWDRVGTWFAAARGGGGVDGWKQDLRFAARTLLKRPGYSLAAVGTLALGIGAAVSVFSVVDGVLLKPLPYPEPDQLVVVWHVDAQSGARARSVDHPDIRAWEEEVPGWDVVGYAGTRPTLTGLGTPEVLTGSRVTGGLMTLLGYAPAFGRDLTVADDQPDAPRILVVSHAFWSERLGRSAGAVGSTLRLSGNSWEIVGVAPPEFDFPRGTDFWAPRRHETDGCDHGCRIMGAIGRLSAGTSLEEVAANVAAVDMRLSEDFPDSHRDARTELQPLLDYEVGDVRQGLFVLLGAVGMVLLIACANVGNLSLSRAAQRADEVAVRVSLGASRVRVVRQLLTESLLLAATAGVLGLLLSAWGTQALIALAPESLPRLDEAGMNMSVLTFAGALVLLTTVAFGVLPAHHLSKSAVRSSASSGRRSIGDRQARFSRSVLISGEVALSLALLLGAGLLFRTLVQIQQVDYGFVVEGAERFRISLPGSRYDSLEVTRFVADFEEKLMTLPGVAAAGTGFGLPLASGSIGTSIGLLDRPEVDPADRPEAAVRPSSAGLLSATGTRLLAGRWFTPQDYYGTQPVAVINQAAAAQFYPGVDPLGRQVEVDVSWSFAETPPMTIVGIVEDVRGESAVGAPEAAVYLANTQFGANSLYVWLRAEPGTESLIPAAREALREADPELAMMDISTLSDVIAQEHATPRFYLTLLGVFSALALLLASVGLYGVVAYAVSQRRREIGIRIALGAASSEVTRMVMLQGVRPVIAGLALGLVLALVGARSLGSLLYGVQPNDPATIVAVTLLLSAVTCVATLLPARRASRIAPAHAIRDD